MQPSQRINYRPLIFVALAWLFAGSEIYKRVSIDLNGTIVSSETSCVQPANNRCATEYIVKSQDGSRHAYIAGTTDQAMPRQLPVGTVVDKHKWSLSYAVSGQERRDSPMGFYSVILVLGLMCAIWWYAVLRHK